MRVLMKVEQLRRTAPGGIGTYVEGLVRGLGELEPRERPDMELAAGRRRGPRRGPDPLRSLGYPLRCSHLPGPLLTRAWDRGLLRAPAGFDVVHATSLSTLEPGRAALVATVHDLLWRRVPDAYPARGRAWHEAALRRALRRADRFVVPAVVVADDLVEAGACREAITVIPMGSDHLPPPDLLGATILLEHLGVRGPFLLSVGTLEPRKNQARLIEAYRRVRASLPEPWPLVLVGPNGWGKQVKPAAGVVLAGLVSPAELSALYDMARLLAYVPYIEGFGLPPVEAMAFGTPVVASRHLPSTGGAAFEVDPHDVESIAHGLLVVATDEDRRTRLGSLGRARAAGLSWSAMARRHLSVWQEAGRHGPGARHG
ncbi:MAG TPA: glycosyltransferase family 1 protein [Acidimicrobiales bacterium]|nr:glycosyltransferase family 1 protein [Acidimicrobiales bacterium]